MSYHVRHYNHYKYKHGKKSPEIQIVERILAIIWWIISLPFRFLFGRKKEGLARRSPASLQDEGGGLDRNYIQTKWREIEQLMQLGHPSNFARAVLEADKLLDHILRSLRAPGTTMADRLKASQKRFSQEAYEAAWNAHKVRNELVHNTQFELMDYSAKSAISNFKKAINELI